MVTIHFYSLDSFLLFRFIYSLDSQYTQLTKVLFRNSKLTPVVLGVLANIPVLLQKEALKLLLVLCNSNPTNTKVLPI
jgi:hypothetical protein